MFGWDEESWRRLRGAALDPDGAAVVRLLAGRPMAPVLQRAGDALLVALAQGAERAKPHAQECIRELEERGWPGDIKLARELAVALGQPAAGHEELAVVPVDLEDLGGSLDGDPGQGDYAVDLKCGDVLPVSVLTGEYSDEPEPAFDEESEEYDPDRWLTFWPRSGEGYRDMEDFAETVDDERLRERLFRALDGRRGVFRRFRDAIWDTSAEQDWLIFRDERAHGRAREWLADQGYRSQVRRLRAV